ncbi:MAG: hypothetical protein LBN00_10755 [Oscillospiraceae bacterium]|jgi:hypothetical protein|nr:hypothetical protein [Oscillospiraceae bacterium]
MKKITRILAIALTLVLVFSLASCAKVAQGSIRTGTWSENTFTNEWINIKVTLPDGWRALTAEELQQSVGAGEEIIVNNGTNQAALDVAKMRTAYDFSVMAEVGVPNAMLMYENLALSPLTKNLDESGYFDSMKTQFEAMADLGYSVLESDETVIAGEKYFVGKLSLMDGAAYQNYYFRKFDGAMIGVILTFTADTQADAESFISSITKAK